MCNGSNSIGFNDFVKLSYVMCVYLLNYIYINSNWIFYSSLHLSISVCLYHFQKLKRMCAHSMSGNPTPTRVTAEFRTLIGRCACGRTLPLNKIFVRKCCGMCFGFRLMHAEYSSSSL